jgi:hypothetical protein
MNAVFDTNFFLMKGQHHDLLKRVLFAKPPICRLALDRRGAIKREYFAALRDYPSVVLREICQRVLERRGPEIATLESEVCVCRGIHDPTSESCELAELERRGCGNEIEPSLFGIALKNPTTLIFLLHGLLGRGYIAEWDFVNARYLSSQSALLFEMYRRISYPSQRYPSTKAQLEELLDEYRIIGRATEHDLLEFKEGPLDFIRFRDDMGIRALRRRIADAVRGMLNSRSGWVLVGIDTEGNIEGFSPAYFEVGHSNPVERFQELMSQDIRSIEPDPLSVDPQGVALWPIDVGNGRIVVSILVTKPDRNIEFFYRGLAHGRLGATTPKIARSR